MLEQEFSQFASNTLDAARPIIDELRQKVDTFNNEATRIQTRIDEITRMANEQILALKTKYATQRAEFGLGIKPLFSKLQAHELIVRESVTRMVSALPESYYAEDYRVAISSNVLVDDVNVFDGVSEVESIISMLNVICVDEQNQPRDISISFYKDKDSNGRVLLNVEGDFGAVDVYFDPDAPNDRDNKMVEIVLLDEEDEDADTIDGDVDEPEDVVSPRENKREDFIQKCEELPTITKLFVFGFFVDLALQNK